MKRSSNDSGGGDVKRPATTRGVRGARGAGGSDNMDLLDGFDDSACLTALEKSRGASGTVLGDTGRHVSVYQEGDYMMTVHNVLASLNLTEDGKPLKLDLNQVADCFANSYYERNEFSACRVDYRYKEVNYAVSIFTSGRIQSTGGVDVEDVKFVLIKFAKHLAVKVPALEYLRCRVEEFGTQNILAVMDLHHVVPLPYLTSLVPGGADYEPEKFPAARFRIPVDREFDTSVAEELSTGDGKNKQALAKNMIDMRSTAEKAREDFLRIKEQQKTEYVTINVFGTGKVTFTGGKSLGAVRYSWNTLLPYVRKCLEPSAVVQQHQHHQYRVHPSLEYQQQQLNNPIANEVIQFPDSAKDHELNSLFNG